MISIVAAAFAGLAAPTVKPTKPWTLNYDIAQCVAYRNYGSEKDPLIMVLKAPPMGDVMQLMVLRKAWRMSPMQVEARVTIGSNPTVRTNMLVYRASEAEYRSHLINLRVSEFAGFSEAPAVEISSSELTYNFVLEDVGPLMAEMDECLKDLREYWNVTNPSVSDGRLASPAFANLSSLFSGADYPASAARAGQQGTTTVVLLIDQDGEVADCSIVGTSGVAIIDAQTCGVIRQRAKFKPALDTNLKPTRSTCQQRITWKLE